MTLRDDIVAVERSMPAAEIARIVGAVEVQPDPGVRAATSTTSPGSCTRSTCSRIPSSRWRTLRRVALARAATPCHELMRRMLREHVHLAIIQGVLGETLGLVTLEDLVEELVGDIRDEHDEPQTGDLVSALALPDSASAGLRALGADFGAGSKAALARAVSIVENQRAGSDVLLAAMHPHIGRAHRIGITGPPGAGQEHAHHALAAETPEVRG